MAKESVARWRKRPVTIEAAQYTGTPENAEMLRAWMQQHDGNLMVTTGATGSSPGTAQLWVEANKAYLTIEPGEWIAHDDLGFYPIKDAVFVKSYEPAGGTEVVS